MGETKNNKYQNCYRQLTAEEEHEIRKRLESLCSAGKQTEGTSKTNDTNVRPNYYDETRFLQAQQTINKYFANISMASSVGLMLLTQLEEILIILLSTGKSRTVANLYERYTTTVMYIKKCYETDFFDPTSKGGRSLSLVRSMHQQAYKTYNSPKYQSLKKPDNKIENYVWVNQYDMALTQFSFIGLFILRPDKCGAFHITEPELSNIVYYWQLFSYQLGIEDRFNLFVYSHDMAKQFRLIELVLEEFKRKLAVPRNQIGVAMARGILLAFEDFATEATFNIVEHHWSDVVSLSGNEHLEPYDGLSERWKLLRFRFTFQYLMKSKFLLHYLNILYKRKVEKFSADSTRIKKKLTKKYPNHIYELDNQPTIS